jgi:hypothetical protein
MGKPESEGRSCGGGRKRGGGQRKPRSTGACASRRKGQTPVDARGNIALSWEGAFGALIKMDATDAEKANARRVQRLLYGLMIVMIGVPLIIFVVRHF